jgi:hypothetical protein
MVTATCYVQHYGRHRAGSHTQRAEQSHLPQRQPESYVHVACQRSTDVVVRVAPQHGAGHRGRHDRCWRWPPRVHYQRLPGPGLDHPPCLRGLRCRGVGDEPLHHVRVVVPEPREQTPGPQQQRPQPEPRQDDPPEGERPAAAPQQGDAVAEARHGHPPPPPLPAGHAEQHDASVASGKNGQRGNERSISGCRAAAPACCLRPNAECRYG